MDDVRPAAKAESIPAALWGIALLALSPFPVSTYLYCYGPASGMGSALNALMLWSAVVLSFLGGVRWGLETREAQPRALRQAFSALCAVAAWVMILARGRLPETWVIGGFIVAFLIQWLFDHQTPDTPSRYPMLSTAVTTAGCVSLAWALEKAMNA
ncbi:DUF3429 domain-containing protein [Phenylobacterium sp.]|uniref:DUF3429 domain-containing protein n=1 Tax=Phenylobacterium sp. TaxID=1871053 RepID=UPI0025DD2B67|nr:DUF3429 domain-containing protein [Phenylobacterium sp.]